MTTIVITGGDGAHPLKKNILEQLRQGKHRYHVIDFDAHRVNPGGPDYTGTDTAAMENFEKGILQAIGDIIKKYEKIDVLISCPVNRVSPDQTKFIHQDNHSWQSILHTTLTSALFTCKAVLPGMMRRKFGRIINVVPAKALRGESEEVVYCAALGGLLTMSKCVAKEVGKHNITMNNICFGLLDIPEEEIREGSTDYAIIKQLPIKRYCSYEDIVNVINFLISGEAAYINGKDIILDGGVM